ncbi:pilus assembly protein TadG-related protein [Rhodopirellula baltica]|uniref:pilus assembly protein TadG-related protein n=1 Tax=Rhodopirellula baltica TaxID=265606 RepID=UPI001F35D6C7|nr:Tad domain-containing protein [Rhodopirellula baltica]
MMGGKETRGGAVLILVVILLFALFAIAGLLIDIGMARLTQAHMQSVSDAAALEGGWQLAMGADQTTTRNAVVDRAAGMSESWGSHRIELEDGHDLNDDGKPESSQTINRDTLGDPIRPMLDPNVDNNTAGDIVLGKYMINEVPDELPGQPMGYDRHAFEPDVNDPNSVLVRLRRTGEDDLAGGASAERLTYLWSRGSLLDLGLKGDGIAVRSESIAKLAPVVAVGTAVSSSLPTAINAAIELVDVRAERFTDVKLLRPEDPFQIGSLMTGGDPEDGVGYLPIASSVMLEGSSEIRVVGFMLASVQDDDVTPMTLSDMGYERANATANLGWVTYPLSHDLLLVHQSLSDVEGDFIACAPALVRSQQIHGGTP